MQLRGDKGFSKSRSNGVMVGGRAGWKNLEAPWVDLGRPWTSLVLV